jgi:HK97 family phage prohead protease
MKLKYKDIAVDNVSEDTRVVTGIISRELVDLDGEVVLISGVDLKVWKRNPVFAYNHNLSEITGHGLTIERSQDEIGVPILIASLKFDTDAFSEEKYQKYKNGSIRQFSIGFDFDEINDTRLTDLDIKKYGPECKRVIYRSTLYEVSAVAIGANQATEVLSIKSAEKTETKDAKIPAKVEAVAKDAVKEEPKEAGKDVAAASTETMKTEPSKEAAKEVIVTDKPIETTLVAEPKVSDLMAVISALSEQVKELTKPKEEVATVITIDKAKINDLRKKGKIGV